MALYRVVSEIFNDKKVIRTDLYRSATCDYLLTFHINHGPIWHRFRDTRRFQSKVAKFSHSL